MKSAIENPTRNASAFTVRLLLPLSFIRKTSAEPRLARISTKAMATRIFMVEPDEAGAKHVERVTL